MYFNLEVFVYKTVYISITFKTKDSFVLCTFELLNLKDDF